jgi:hypothetical protein
MTRPEEGFPILAMLRAEGPHPDHREELMLFGRLVGTWDVRVLFYGEDGTKTYDQPGVWSFSWVLDGRAVQDVLVYPNPDSALKNTPGSRRIGTTLRYYDPRLGAWRVIWLEAVTGDLGVMTGRRAGEEIWIEEEEPDGSLTRWIFAEMEGDRFHWKGTLTRDRGKSWRMGQEMFATRRTSG